MAFVACGVLAVVLFACVSWVDEDLRHWEWPDEYSGAGWQRTTVYAIGSVLAAAVVVFGVSAVLS